VTRTAPKACIYYPDRSLVFPSNSGVIEYLKKLSYSHISVDKVDVHPCNTRAVVLAVNAVVDAP